MHAKNFDFCRDRFQTCLSVPKWMAATVMQHVKNVKITIIAANEGIIFLHFEGVKNGHQMF